MELRHRKPSSNSKPLENSNPDPATSKHASSSSNDLSQTSKAPLILRPWVYLQENLPPVTFCGLNCSVLLLSMLYFFLVRMFAIYLFDINGWPKATVETNFNIGCLVSMCHSTPMILPLIASVYSQPSFAPSGRLSNAPKHMQLAIDALLQFCTGYMVQDSIATFYYASQIGFQASDPLFLGHHFATVTYMTQSRWINAGQISAISCILIGEISNPPMMVWYITERAIASACCNGPRVMAIYGVTKVIYAAVYVVARAVFMSSVTGYYFYDFFFTGQKNVSFGICVYWVFACVAVLAGSYDYIVECWGIVKDTFL